MAMARRMGVNHIGGIACVFGLGRSDNGAERQDCGEH
jgi:hypothetical protein